MKNYIIYLPTFQSSARMFDHAARSGLSLGWEIYPFEGIDGRTVADDNNWNKWNIKFNDTDKKCRKLLERPGVRGCFLSHYSLWKRCANFNEPIGIFEHDIEFLLPPPQISNLKDILKLEGFTLNKARPAGPWYEGARAYIITPHGAKKLIQWIEVNGCLPADVVIGTDVVDIEFDLNQRVVTTHQPTNRKERHTNSFTWNLEQMV